MKNKDEESKSEQAAKFILILLVICMFTLGALGLGLYWVIDFLDNNPGGHI